MCISLTWTEFIHSEKQIVLNSRRPKVSVALNIADITIFLIQLYKSGRF